ncbi:MAG: 5-(carboxyamino)imidazole ribonucleotide mutase, partial [Nanoarchaeota archaeon]|nr:5-(carboxyamino)imidazole ribonucleotide mutase [Nanoarchaeota archaeon]
MADVLVLFGSKSDEDTYKQILKIFDRQKISYELKVASAHKTPEDVDDILRQDYKIIIAGAGLSAALPGVVASKTIRPVIGVPCAGNYQGLDALLSIMQMPPGIPVLSVGAGKADAAAYAAVDILRQSKKVVLVGDKSSKAFKKAEEILRQFGVNHAHSMQIADNAINI